MIGVYSSGKSELTLDRSRFIGSLFPIQTLEEVKLVLTELKKTHPSAAHIPFSYIIADQLYGDDDGEPSGTAGLPLLNLLKRAPIDCGLLVVIRYFGGRKLGSKRLRECFIQAGEMAINNSILGEVGERFLIHLVGPIEEMGHIHRFCMETGATIQNITYNNKIDAQLISNSLISGDVIKRLMNRWTLEDVQKERFVRPIKFEE
jgi:putative IMPACT (imprinted ancient) family translation regulator